MESSLNPEVIVAALTLATVVFNAINQKKIKKQVTETNDAVNHRHDKEPINGEAPPKLYDLVIDNHLKITELTEWKDGFKLKDSGDVDDLFNRIETIEENQKEGIEEDE